MRINTQLCATAVGLMVGAAAYAQSTERPWYVGAVIDVSRESNVLGLLPGNEIADTIYTTSLRGGLNQPFGRQRVYADVTLNHQTYDDISGRDNNGYSIGAGFDWSTVERLSGAFVFHANQQLTDFIVGDIVPTTIANTEKSEDFEARVRLGVVTTLAFDAMLGTRKVEFSAPEFASSQYQADRGSLGITYRPSGILTLGTGYSAQRTHYEVAAVGQTSPDTSERQDIYFTAEWIPTGASTVRARINVGKTEYELATAADFDGVTGYLTWLWRPTGALSLTTSVSRDIGQDSGFLRLGDSTAVSATDFSRVTNTFSLRAGYDLTGKISMTGELRYDDRELVDGISGETGQEKNSFVSLGARWAATRTLSTGCNVSWERRSSSGVGTRPYDNDRVNCYGQVMFD